MANGRLPTRWWEPAAANGLPETARAALAGVLVLAAAVWLGGFVTLVVVVRVAHQTLGPAERVAFFRRLGRRYGMVAGLALALALATGASLLYQRRWDGPLTATAVVAAGLVAATVLGVTQARQMTRLRGEAVRRPDDAVLAGQVRRGARTGRILRTVIGALSITLLALGIVLAT